jgi:hypothetical protein
LDAKRGSQLQAIRQRYSCRSKADIGKHGPAETFWIDSRQFLERKRGKTCRQAYRATNQAADHEPACRAGRCRHRIARDRTIKRANNWDVLQWIELRQQRLEAAVPQRRSARCDRSCLAGGHYTHRPEDREQGAVTHMSHWHMGHR